MTAKAKVSLAEKVKLASPKRALVTILEDEPVFIAHKNTLLSEAALAEDWNRPKEDEAWLHLKVEG